ncbi:tetratricopeptide repeat protein [Ichthyenterobacterium magnum]|uniref:Tetratricopeptide repeat protein n=1 Tax=Ichthyenterobacterium magnum TaxID=1230530 RepID=A0A420DXD5_9FLAO|nr:tetratricopeptide repeat protein [Ichthyenterobacterium magnum]RKE98873.1 tetratricopeptide repeat protein [Ichthyenterobacterium magnum]
MKKSIHILIFFFGTLLFPKFTYAQVDFNKRPNDDLGNVEDVYQEHFFEALKQKGIENYQRSVDALLKCIKIDDSDAVLYFELGKNYKLLKNFGAAEDALLKATSKQPKNEWYLDELYDVYILQDDMDKAVKTVKQLVKFHPDYKQDLASLYIKAKKYNNALEILDELDKEFGTNEDRDYLRNQVYNITGNDKDRIENLEDRVKNNPEDEANYLRLIYRYSEMGNTKKAFNAAKNLLALKPNSHLVHLALYKFYLDNNNTSSAIASMKTVLTSSEIKPEAKAKVLKDFVDFVALHPEHEGDLIEITSLVSEEKSVKTLVELAQYHLKANDKQKALSYYQEALNEEPNNFTIIKDVLLLQIDLNLDKEALVKSNEALELFPAQPIFYLINGVANNKLKQSKKAIESLETGLDYLIDNPNMQRDFYSQLSIAYKQVNNIVKSQAFTKKAEALTKEQ